MRITLHKYIPGLKHLRLKSVLPKTLFARSLLILIVPVLLIQVIAVFMFFDRHWSKMTTRLASAVAGEIAILAEGFDGEIPLAQTEGIAENAARYLDMLVRFHGNAALPEAGPRYTGFDWGGMVERTLYAQINAQVRRPFLLRMDFERKWVEVRVQLGNGVLDVSFPQRRLFSSSGYIFLLWMIGSSVVLVMIAVLFMRNQIRPIRRLAIAADRFGKGRDVHVFKLEGAVEVRQAGRAFIDMRDRIQRQISQRTTMLAGVSHDLRTPLTRLKLQLEMLGDSPDVDAMKSDIIEMERMIAGYLDFVRGDGEEQVALTSLSDLFARLIVSARRQGHDITLNGNVEISLMLRPMAFERCLGNLVNNAGKYAEHIWLGARRLEGYIEISIEDDGPGIDAAEYEEVFKPFYRVDSARSSLTGGVGLGLPIAMEIVHGHGGEIWLEKSPYGGLRVVIHLPV